MELSCSELQPCSGASVRFPPFDQLAAIRRNGAVGDRIHDGFTLDAEAALLFS
jgi:hypothetical protein